MVSLVLFPHAALSVSLMQLMPAFVVVGLAVSAVLSGWLQTRPRIQKYVTAVAMATVLAMSIYRAAHPVPVSARAFGVIFCDEWWNYLTCLLF